MAEAKTAALPVTKQEVALLMEMAGKVSVPLPVAEVGATLYAKIRDAQQALADEKAA